jgi:hypothetical protein
MIAVIGGRRRLDGSVVLRGVVTAAAEREDEENRGGAGGELHGGGPWASADPTAAGAPPHAGGGAARIAHRRAREHVTVERFESSDGWILCSIALSDSLSGLVGVADHLNACLPMLEEINGALIRLGRAGLVSWDGRYFVVSSEVRAFDECIQHEPARHRCQKFSAFLASFRPDPKVPQREDVPLVTREQLDAASRAYEERVHGRRRRR